MCMAGLLVSTSHKSHNGPIFKTLLNLHRRLAIAFSPFPSMLASVLLIFCESFLDFGIEFSVFLLWCFNYWPLSFKLSMGEFLVVLWLLPYSSPVAMC